MPGELDRAPDRLVASCPPSGARAALAAAPPRRETRAPRRSGSRERPESRSRRLSSWSSLGHAKSRSSRARCVALLRSRNDRVEVAEPQVLLGEPEVVRQLLARGLLDDARAGERDQRARLGDRDVAERLRRSRARPPVVGCAITMNIGSRASCRSSTAQTVFGSCISERIPSCMRAPPELVTETSGTPRSIAESQARDELLADGAPHRAAHEREVHDRELGRDGRRSSPGRSPSPRRDRCSAPPRRAARRTGAGRRSRAGRRSGGRPPPRRTCPRRRATSIRARARIGKWWPQCAHTRSAPLELVVAVVRAAPGAGVRVLASRRAWRVLVLDLDVDPGVGHVRELRRRAVAAVTARARQPSARASRGRIARVRADQRGR